MLRRELQGHLSDVLANLTFENQNALQKARSFISYMPANKTKDDTAYVVKEFVEISDELAEEIGDNEQYAQWRVRLFER